MRLILLASLLAFATPAAAQISAGPMGPFAVVVPGHDTTLLSPHTDTPSNAAVLELTIPPRTFGAPPHIHSKEDEHFYVLEGALEFLDRESTVVAGQGTLVVLPRDDLAI